MAFRSLKFTYVGKKVLGANQCGSGSETLPFANLRFCDLRTGTPRKFADLRFADLASQKSTNLRLRNEPKNLRICDLRFAD
jgi:hypothetical protein